VISDSAVETSGGFRVQIKDAAALVTGGASGLGLATTKRLLDAGAQVVVLDIKGEDVVRELGERALFAPADVTDEEGVIAALDLADSLGPLRIVVNCAGTGNAIRVLGKDVSSRSRRFAGSSTSI
jgi:NAD(P)-dependent dehydrogenase (short-subunit alcohol dehydrogenase family)